MAVAPACDLPPAYVYESNIHIGNVLMTLNDQRKSGLLCDISIIVQSTEFKAHKAILASCSSYFNRIITDPANVSHNIVLELSSISKIGMESLLEFAYTSKLTVTQANIDDVICAARELEFKNIEFSCLTYLKQQLTSGESSSCLMGNEATSYCGNSKISRQGEQSTKPAKSTVECHSEKKNPAKSEKKDPCVRKECQFMAKFNFGSRKKPQTTANVAETDTASKECKEFKYDNGVRKTEMIEQMSQEQHQAMIKKILECHGLEAATVDEKAMEVGATETTSTSGYSSKQRYRSRPACPGQEKKISGYLSPSYNSDDTDEAGSVDGENDMSSCAMRQCGKMRKQPAIKLPFTMDEITSMPRAELHDMLTRDPNLTPEQICAIHEIRRRGKNRIAAQRCRKRKMECIRSLVEEIETLRSEHAQLMNDRRDARDQAIKLSDKFRAKCEKFFKCDKNKCVKKKFCSGGASSGPTLPDEQQLIAPNSDSAQTFQIHAQKAQDLCNRLKEAPINDLPPCTLMSSPESNSWNKSAETEDIVCTIIDDGGYQDCSPSSAYIGSPSQGLGSDFGNIHISPPGSGTVPTSACGTRTSVVLHTSSVDGQAAAGQTLPPIVLCHGKSMTIDRAQSLLPLTHHSNKMQFISIARTPSDAQMTDLSHGSANIQ